MNREEALRKAVEIAPAGTEPESVLAYADWLLEGWDDPVEVPSEVMYSVGDVGISMHGFVWVMVEDGEWEVYGNYGYKSSVTYDNRNARTHQVVVVGKVRPSGPSGPDFQGLLGESVLEENVANYPVGLLALDDEGDVWEYLGKDEWDYYYGNDGRRARAVHTTNTAEAWGSTIVGGIRG